MVDLSETQAEHFFANREAAGFNSVWVNLLCNQYTGGRANGTTYDGIAPFTSAGNLATPNPAYFRRVDAMIRLAAKPPRGIPRSDRDRRLAQGPARQRDSQGLRVRALPGAPVQALSQHRLAGRQRLPDLEPAGDDALVLAVAKGIRSVDPDQLQTVELNFLTSTSLDDPRWSGIVALNAAYTYSPTYAEVLKGYDHPDHVPVFMVEANYEGEHAYTGPETLRRQEYWTMLSGATGQFYGNKYTWQFLPGWPGYLDTIGSRQMTFVTNLFARRPWFDLVPDTGHTLVVAGYGTYSDSGDVNGSDYVTAARTPDGRLAIAYLPTDHPVVVDMRRMAGPRVRADWYDPTSGRYRTIAGSPLARGARLTFTPPGKNQGGKEDWVLVLTAA